LYNKKEGNVFLKNNLYKQVQIAYAVPRTISLITVTGSNLYNLFPTDLHGSIGDQFYSVSLRINGKACMQVEAAKRIVVSEMHSDAYKTAYSLGKNHMQELKARDNFPFSELVSAILKFPLPNLVLKYRELELIETFDHGIHKLFLFKIISHHAVSDEKATLTHIHNVYATWRHNKALPGNYLLR
jgi:flavin reductase (DIM6/NTAB) family NADH-FMN oxidoreductase RutF